MTRVLLVDLGPDLSLRLQHTLTQAGFDVIIVHNDKEALQTLDLSPAEPSAILIAPQAETFELIETLHETHPCSLIFVITEHDRDEVTTAALLRGAVGYIPSQRLEESLLRTLRSVTGLTIRTDHRHHDLMDAWSRTAAEFVLDNRSTTVTALVSYVRETLQLLRFSDQGTIVRTCVALTEALDNALYHGNLELSSELRKGSGEAWEAAVAERRQLSPYKDRHIFVRAELSRTEVSVTIRDEGPGFDPSKLPDPTEPDNIESVCGRGVFLVRTFMDEVRYNDKGNEITLIKRCGPSPQQ
jgi:anti-sigma regulatory factor (Ser/Thr protein kinase)/ActR/RegA family two-component response regulator